MLIKNRLEIEEYDDFFLIREKNRGTALAKCGFRQEAEIVKQILECESEAIENHFKPKEKSLYTKRQAIKATKKSYEPIAVKAW